MKLFLFVVLIFLPPATPAVDCVCVKEPLPSEEKVNADRRHVYNKAKAVFAGKVVALDAYKILLNWRSGGKATLSTKLR